MAFEKREEGAVDKGIEIKRSIVTILRQLFFPTMF